MFIANSGVALPSFLVAPILIIIFSFWLKWLPPALWDGPLYYIMPVITLRDSSCGSDRAFDSFKRTGCDSL
jgi:ABC-type dipeptide/oligopeptide/nickel transport system permease component